MTGELPAEYKQFVAAYGPGVVGDFLSVLHPQASEYTMIDLMNMRGPLYQALVPNRIPYDLYPRERGMVLWANTEEGDACFLIPRADGSWGIGVWFRQWAGAMLRTCGSAPRERAKGVPSRVIDRPVTE
ncbi:hypothetical protein ACFV1W_25180 [Kitasatospora sp. NPDC059648]|uniref:hypothetical protein n=1 Tax=Kitasatospora sp. NPDC059648 TaxID=3346894 RepID=UPI0036A3BD54